MSNIRELLDSDNILNTILSLKDEDLFSYFKELSNLDFHLNRHGITTEHQFTVLEHTKRALRIFAQAFKYAENPELFDSEMIVGTSYKKDFLRRVMQLINELDLKSQSDDFKIIVLGLLLHDVGKGFYDISDAEIEEESLKYKKKGATYSPEYLKLYYKNKDHEGRGAFLAYSILEEVEGVNHSFANRVKHIILGHGDFNKFHSKEDFNFLVFLRRIMEYSTEYNFPIIHQPNPEELLIHELNMNYLFYLIDVYSVDDKGLVWHSVRQKKHTIYLKAKWLLGRRLEDLLDIVHKWCSCFDNEKREQVDSILKKSFIQSFRTNTGFLLDTKLEGICQPKEKQELLEIIHHYFDHTDRMVPRYLTQTNSEEKWHHINLLKKAKSNINYDFLAHKDLLEVTVVKKYAPKGTLKRLVKALIDTGIDSDSIFKIIGLSAYSGDDERLVDIFTLKYYDDFHISEDTFQSFRNHLDILNHPDNQSGKLNIIIPKQDLHYRLNSIIDISLNNIEVGLRNYQELKIETGILSNIILFSSLSALSFINITEVKVEEFENSYAYIFLLRPVQNYKLTSKSVFKKEFIQHLYQNVTAVE